MALAAASRTVTRNRNLETQDPAALQVSCRAKPNLAPRGPNHAEPYSDGLMQMMNRAPGRLKRAATHARIRGTVSGTAALRVGRENRGRSASEYRGGDPPLLGAVPNSTCHAMPSSFEVMVGERTTPGEQRLHKELDATPISYGSLSPAITVTGSMNIPARFPDPAPQPILVATRAES